MIRFLKVLTLSALAVSMAASSSAIAQSIPDIGSTGIREPARLNDELLGPSGPAFAPAAAPGVTSLVIPGFIHTEGADLFGVTLGMIDRTRLNGLPLQLRAGYRRMDLATTGFNQLVLDGKMKLRKFQFGSEIAFSGKFQKTFDASTRLEGGGALDHRLLTSGDRWLGVGGTALYRVNKPDVGSEQSAPHTVITVAMLKKQHPRGKLRGEQSDASLPRRNHSLVATSTGGLAAGAAVMRLGGAAVRSLSDGRWAVVRCDPRAAPLPRTCKRIGAAVFEHRQLLRRDLARRRCVGEGEGAFLQRRVVLDDQHRGIRSSRSNDRPRG